MDEADGRGQERKERERERKKTCFPSQRISPNVSLPPKTTIFSGIPACVLSEIIAFAENLGRWGLESEVTPSPAGTGKQLF